MSEKTSKNGNLFITILTKPITIIVILLSLFFIFSEKIKDFLIGKLLRIIHAYTKKKRPKRIILVRHGQSEANLNYEILNTKNDHFVHLTEKGKEQARKAGRTIKELIGNESIRFYVSPYQRTIETYEGVLEALKDNDYFTTFDGRIREQEIGNLRNPKYLEQEKTQKEIGIYYYRFPNGESGADVYNRVSIFLQDMFRGIMSVDSNKRENIVIVCHSLTITFFMMNVLGLTIEEYETIRLPENGECWILEKNNDGKYKLKSDIFKKDSGKTLSSVKTLNI